MRYWLMSADGDVRGPFDRDQLAGQTASGHLDPKTAKLCAEGSSDWVLASLVLAANVDPSSSGDAQAEVVPVAEEDDSAWSAFFRRVAAKVIDLFVVSAALHISGCTGVLSVLRDDDEWRSDDRAFALFVSIVVVLVASWVYFAAMESSAWQATLGKRALGIVVTDLRGARMSFECASIRFASSLVSAAILGLGFLVMLVNARCQCLHDVIAGTAVTRRPVASSSSPDRTGDALL
jgi:uncharacterized RDD family membrane protein YckC